MSFLLNVMLGSLDKASPFMCPRRMFFECNFTALMCKNYGKCVVCLQWEVPFSAAH
jgi:hypothetical protein